MVGLCPSSVNQRPRVTVFHRHSGMLAFAIAEGENG